MLVEVWRLSLRLRLVLEVAVGGFVSEGVVSRVDVLLGLGVEGLCGLWYSFY